MKISIFFNSIYIFNLFFNCHYVFFKLDHSLGGGKTNLEGAPHPALPQFTPLIIGIRTVSNIVHQLLLRIFHFKCDVTLIYINYLWMGQFWQLESSTSKFWHFSNTLYLKKKLIKQETYWKKFHGTQSCRYKCSNSNFLLANIEYLNN